MDDFNTYEYAAAQKSEGKWLVYRILLMTFYVLYCVGYFIFIFKTRMIPLGALIPVTLWIIIYFTWKYTKPDYKYVIEGGKLTFLVIYGNKKKRKKTEIRISSASKIAPVCNITADISDFAPQTVYNALPRANAADAYAILYNDEGGKRCVFYFVATAQALKLLHFYNSRTEVVKTAN